jgi:hypothetical protein
VSGWLSASEHSSTSDGEIRVILGLESRSWCLGHGSTLAASSLGAMEVLCCSEESASLSGDHDGIKDSPVGLAGIEQ